MASTRRYIIRRRTALILALLLGLSWLGLPEGASASNVQDSLTVGIALNKTPVLRPLDPQERDIVSVYNLIYDSLVTIDDSYEPAAGAAESWEKSSDCRTWTFHLRSNICFSDGTPLTAQDVAATVNYILSRASSEESTNRGYYRNLSYFVDSVSVNGDSTVVFRAKAGRRYYGFIYAMTFPILRADQLDTDNPLGSGPYMVTRYDQGESLWLEANPYWWHSQPQVKQIAFMIHSLEKEVIESYQYARVDTIFTRSISASSYSTGNTTMVMASRTNQLETLLINNNSFPLNDVNIRRAIRLAIDADALAAKVYNGMVLRADVPFIPGTWMYSDNLPGDFRRNIVEAARLLEEAGWVDLDDNSVRDKPKDDGSGNYHLHLRLLVYEEPDNSVRVSAATQISEWLAAVGIETEIISGTMQTIQDRLAAGNFDLCLASFAMDVVPDPGFLLMSGNTADYSRYRNADMTALFTELRAQTSKGGYQQVLYRIQEKYVTDCPFICLYWRRGVVLTRKMYTTNRDVRELELLRGIETFNTN